MKYAKVIVVFLLVVLSSCKTVRVVSDYDTKVDFTKYKTFAFYKPEIDKAKISDLDKKRVLRAIESELTAKGFTKSKNPDILVGIFTKSRQKININQNNVGFRWGCNPWWGMNNNINVNQFTEETLFIDFIDKEKKELVWQGIGTGALRLQSRENKEARIKEFVKEIISKFPSNQEKK